VIVGQMSDTKYEYVSHPSPRTSVYHVKGVTGKKKNSKYQASVDPKVPWRINETKNGEKTIHLCQGRNG